MPFELRLTFSGLTPLVPRKEATDPTEAREWLVVMPALQGGDRLQLPNNGKVFNVAPHQAVLMTNAQAVRPETTKPIRLRFRDPRRTPGDEQSDLLFEIDQELLEIDSGAGTLQVKSGTSAQNVPDLQKPDQLHDIKWVPPIDNCLDAGVHFDRSLLDSQTLLPTSSALTGVVRLDRGALETTDVHRGLNESKQVIPVPYEFRKGSATGAIRFQQALANGFHLRVDVPEETAGLLLTDHLGNKTRLVVGAYPGCPVNENGVPLVEVKVFNEELEEILGLGRPPGNPDPQEGDTDFVVFYSLSPVWSTLDVQNIVLPYIGSGGPGGESRPCEPPQYTGMGG